MTKIFLITKLRPVSHDKDISQGKTVFHDKAVFHDQAVYHDKAFSGYNEVSYDKAVSPYKALSLDKVASYGDGGQHKMIKPRTFKINNLLYIHAYFCGSVVYKESIVTVAVRLNL